MKETLDDFFAALDQLYADKRLSHIEPFFKETMERHRIGCGDHDAVFVTALNELGTYYRSQDRYEDALKAFTACGQDILAQGKKDSSAYATNLINQASVYKAQQNFSKAQALYEEALEIFVRVTGPKSYGTASCFNNLSLLYLDKKDYQNALNCAEKALGIIELLPQYEEETAISLLNRATALWFLERKEAQEVAQKALALYEALPTKGVHYAAALNLCATMELKAHNLDKALAYLQKAKAYLYQSVGPTQEYLQACLNMAYTEERLAAQQAGTSPAPTSLPTENKVSSTAQWAGTTPAPTSSKTGTPTQRAKTQGLALAHAYYLEVAKPLLAQTFPEFLPRMAVGLVGDGSECYGFDDEISRDHDWGPGFCLWLTDADYTLYGAQLQIFYNSLPTSYQGFTRKIEPTGQNRVGVMRTSDFYKQFIGPYQPPQTWQEWNMLPENMLAKATNGEVFSDPLGNFTALRNALLAYYPVAVRLKKLSVRAATMAQSGQYNYPRCVQRGDLVAANFARQEFILAAHSFLHLLRQKYLPYYKWSYRSLLTLPALGSVPTKLLQLSTTQDTAVATALIEEICDEIRMLCKQDGLASSNDAFLIALAEELRAKITIPSLAALAILQEY